jgi:hypothetical protein
MLAAGSVGTYKTAGKLVPAGQLIIEGARRSMRAKRISNRAEAVRERPGRRSRCEMEQKR